MPTLNIKGDRGGGGGLSQSFDQLPWLRLDGGATLSDQWSDIPCAPLTESVSSSSLSRDDNRRKSLSMTLTEGLRAFTKQSRDLTRRPQARDTLTHSITVTIFTYQLCHTRRDLTRRVQLGDT